MKKWGYTFYGIFLIALMVQIGYAISESLTFSTTGKIIIVSLQVIGLLLGTHFYMHNKNIHKDKIRQTITILLFIIFVANLVYLLFYDRDFGRSHQYLDYSLAEYIQDNVNLVPFESIHLYLRAWSQGTLSWQMISLNLLGNLIVFMPFAYFLPHFFRSQRKWYIFIPTMIIMVFFVEVAQVYTQSGSGDIDDLILNVLGTIIVYLVLKIPFLSRHVFIEDK